MMALPGCCLYTTKTSPGSPSLGCVGGSATAWLQSLGCAHSTSPVLPLQAELCAGVHRDAVPGSLKSSCTAQPGELLGLRHPHHHCWPCHSLQEHFHLHFCAQAAQQL